VSTKKTKTKAIYDDHDDAHFDGNPAYRKRHVTKRAANARTERNLHKTAKQPNRKQKSRKRVAGK
jgi:hypothetical protein